MFIIYGDENVKNIITFFINRVIFDPFVFDVKLHEHDAPVIRDKYLCKEKRHFHIRFITRNYL